MEKTTPFENLHAREYRIHDNEVRSVAWNFTGTKLASGSEDQSVRVWDIEIEPHGNGSCVDMKGHMGSVEWLCWNPNHADLVATNGSHPKNVVVFRPSTILLKMSLDCSLLRDKCPL